MVRLVTDQAKSFIFGSCPNMGRAHSVGRLWCSSGTLPATAGADPDLLKP